MYHSLPYTTYLQVLCFSFPICYQVEFSERLAIDESGVPLEHLISCIPNVQIFYGGPSKNIKYLKQCASKSGSDADGKFHNIFT